MEKLRLRLYLYIYHETLNSSQLRRRRGHMHRGHSPRTISKTEFSIFSAKLDWQRQQQFLALHATIHGTRSSASRPRSSLLHSGFRRLLVSQDSRISRWGNGLGLSHEAVHHRLGACRPYGRHLLCPRQPRAGHVRGMDGQCAFGDGLTYVGLMIRPASMPNAACLLRSCCACGAWAVSSPI